MIYYVIELQTNDTGSAIPMAYNTLADAEEHYHDVLKYAVKSSVRVHGAVLMNENGLVLKQEVYNHEN